MIVNKKPIVSVVMAAYNSQRHISSAIDSVREQSFVNWELIAVDDGSVDETADIIAAYARVDARIRLERMGVNSGVAMARNRGLEMAQGRYVAFLDSDDIWLPDKLQRQLTLAEQTGASLIYSSYSIIDQYGNKICEDYLVPDEIVLDMLLRDNVIGCSTVFLTAEVAREFRFDPSCYHEDYLLWLQILSAGFRASGCVRSLVCWRYTPGSRSFNKCKGAYHRWLVYRKHIRLSLVTSMRYFVLYALNGLRKYRKI